MVLAIDRPEPEEMTGETFGWSDFPVLTSSAPLYPTRSTVTKKRALVEESARIQEEPLANVLLAPELEELKLKPVQPEAIDCFGWGDLPLLTSEAPLHPAHGHKTRTEPSDHVIQEAALIESRCSLSKKEEDDEPQKETQSNNNNNKSKPEPVFGWLQQFSKFLQSPAVSFGLEETSDSDEDDEEEIHGYVGEYAIAMD